MATNVWRGLAANVAQVHTCTLAATWANADTATLTINQKAVVYTVSGLSGNALNFVCRNVVNTMNGSTIPEFEEITWARASNTTFTATADTAGKPFIFTVSNTTAGNGTLALTATTASSGAYHADTAANWSLDRAVNNGDDIVFENSNVPCLYGLDTSAANTILSLEIKQSYTGTIGLPRVEPGGEYVEYRCRYLSIANSPSIHIGDGSGPGSGRIMLNIATAFSAVTVMDTGSALESGIPAVLIRNADNTCTLDVLKGSVGAAFFAGESAGFATIRVSHRGSPAGDATLLCGSGCNTNILTMTGGTVEIENSTTTVLVEEGTLTILGTVPVTTLTIDGGIVHDRSSGTFTTLTVGPGGEYARTQDLRAKFISNVVLYKGATYRDPAGTIILTNGLDLTRCTPAEVTLDTAPHKTWTPTAI